MFSVLHEYTPDPPLVDLPFFFVFSRTLHIIRTYPPHAAAPPLHRCSSPFRSGRDGGSALQLVTRALCSAHRSWNISITVCAHGLAPTSTWKFMVWSSCPAQPATLLALRVRGDPPRRATLRLRAPAAWLYRAHAAREGRAPAPGESSTSTPAHGAEHGGDCSCVEIPAERWAEGMRTTIGDLQTCNAFGLRDLGLPLTLRLLLKPFTPDDCPPDPPPPPCEPYLLLAEHPTDLLACLCSPAASAVRPCEGPNHRLTTRTFFLPFPPPQGIRML
ncbi:hypothetical protein DFH27DRAFT_30939 [Peziza echinospora]|nr:hypothetical protein DFH27DRAFT_30939 [Peziza echinospora]